MPPNPIIRPKVKMLAADSEPMFKLPSPCHGHGPAPTLYSEMKASGVSQVNSERHSAAWQAKEMLNRRPDIEDVLLEALELSVNDVLSR
mmetsp:Transcript_31783/g.39532  ORF Transcript_31783/g.39532 Transcript_31783/m.39532 type:complete len:89 (-) Transcript_31783:776-1042(-)|eukprot:CAMPEP_0170462130 /NCGR_PEP_ID=MMETSP0123-20130129/7754_1 /TAXON_ID=182087 /ORGANISM="Favella ehrenbergii, Strain Fehren 1" /LENGTH=88 /DNA_ID=CAMNT_0010727279 /DNA_START=154 /DNA_END=420 /DNA_ORIENTATION=+